MNELLEHFALLDREPYVRPKPPPPTLDDLIARGNARRSLPPPDERRRLRKAAGLTLEDVANAFGVTGQSVANWERGVSMPARDRIPEYVRLLAGIRERLEADQ